MAAFDLWNPHQDRVLVGPGEAVVPDTQWKDSHLQKSCSRRHGGYRRLFAGELVILRSHNHLSPFVTQTIR